MIQWIPINGTTFQAALELLRPSPLKSAVEHDKTETAAWYGRGEKPEPTVDFEFTLIETSKPEKPGLFVVHGEGRYQGLGFADGL